MVQTGGKCEKYRLDTQSCSSDNFISTFTLKDKCAVLTVKSPSASMFFQLVTLLISKNILMNMLILLNKYEQLSKFMNVYDEQNDACTSKLFTYNFSFSLHLS